MSGVKQQQHSSSSSSNSSNNINLIGAIDQGTASSRFLVFDPTDETKVSERQPYSGRASQPIWGYPWDQ